MAWENHKIVRNINRIRYHSSDVASIDQPFLALPKPFWREL